MGKGEIACYEQFLLFLEVFKKLVFQGHQKVSLCWNGLKQSHPVKGQHLIDTLLFFLQDDDMRTISEEEKPELQKVFAKITQKSNGHVK